MTGHTLRVLMVVENCPYPQDSRVRSEAEALTAAGHQVCVIAPAAPRQPWRELVRGVDVRRYPAPWAIPGALGYVCEYSYSFVAALVLSVERLLTRGVDVVHAHNPPDTLFVIGALFRVLGRQFVFDHHDLAPEMYVAKFGPRARPWVTRILRACERWSCRVANHVIATNDSYRTHDMVRNGVPLERVTIVRNGPDVQRLRPVDPDPEIRGRAAFVFGYVGVIGTQDGVDYLLRALRHLKDDLGRRDWYCVIVGDGDALDDLRRQVPVLGLDAHVWLPGRLEGDRLITCLASADICVVPDPSNDYTDRSTMIKLMEYMALGKPSVAFDLTEHRRTAEDAAVYARPNDELAFAQALLTLMDDPIRRAQMGHFARRRAEDVLAWSHSVVNLLAAYQRLDRGVSTPVPALDPPTHSGTTR